MARIKIVGNAVVVISSMKMEDLETIKKYRPNALTLYEGEGKEKEPVFKIGVGKNYGVINKYGAEFGGTTHDDAALATITMVVGEEVEDIKGYVADNIGYPILQLNKLEATLQAVLDEIRAEKATIESNITIVE